MWKRNNGLSIEAPLSERCGNSCDTPTVTAPHLDSTDPATLAIHTDGNAGLVEDFDPLVTGELSGFNGSSQRSRGFHFTSNIYLYSNVV
jgi:hypothetical protein